MNVALLNTCISFERNTAQTDAVGNHTNTWEDYYTCFATVGGERGTEHEETGVTVPDGTASFTVRYCALSAAVTTDDYRIVWRGDIYNITHIDHQNNKRKSLKFWAKKARR